MPGFEEWAVVELFGHQKIAGKVTEANIAGGSMLRVDVPDVEGQPGFTRYLGAGAIYAINPCSEEIARRAAAFHQVQPVRPYELAPALPPAPHDAEACGECGRRAEIAVVRNGVPLCRDCWDDHVETARDVADDEIETSAPSDVADLGQCEGCGSPATGIDVDGIRLCAKCAAAAPAAPAEYTDDDEEETSAPSDVDGDGKDAEAPW